MTTTITNIDQWVGQYKEQSLEMRHEDSTFELASPDDSLLVAGPARLHAFNDTTEGADLDSGEFYVIGVCQSIQINETSQVQPVKAIGSPRHVFSRTNQPVSVSIQRMMFFGKNLARALYGHVGFKALGVTDPGVITHEKGVQQKDIFYSNLEADLFRTSFGMGIIYNSAKAAVNTTASTVAIGAEYLEHCLVQSRAVSIQSGQATIMEQVQLIADRLVPWTTYSNPKAV